MYSTFTAVVKLLLFDHQCESLRWSDMLPGLCNRLAALFRSHNLKVNLDQLYKTVLQNIALQLYNYAVKTDLSLSLRASFNP